MANVKDILFDENGNYIARGGDFAVDESDQDHIRDILQAAPGHYKQSPMIGANVTSHLKGSDMGSFIRAIKINLGIDGYKNITVRQTGDNLGIDAER